MNGLFIKITVVIILTFNSVGFGQNCINPKILNKDLGYTYYNKKGKKKGSFRYIIKKRKRGYLFTISEGEKELSSFDILMNCKNGFITYDGDINLLSSNRNLANSIDLLISGIAEYPINPKKGTELSQLKSITEFKTEGNLMQGKVTSSSLIRKVTGFQKFLTLYGKITTYIIESNHKTEFESNVLNMSFSGSSKEYFSPDFGIPILTESYNEKGNLVGFTRLNGSMFFEEDVQEKKKCQESIYIIHDVPLIPQITNKSCWAAGAAMLLSFHEKRTYTPYEIAEISDLLDSYGHNNKGTGLILGNFENFIEKLYLDAMPLYGIDVCELKSMLEYGPILFLQARPNFGLHAAVATGIYGDGTSEGTFIKINDPWGIVPSNPTEEDMLKNDGWSTEISVKEFFQRMDDWETVLRKVKSDTEMDANYNFAFQYKPQ